MLLADPTSAWAETPTGRNGRALLTKENIVTSRQCRAALIVLAAVVTALALGVGSAPAYASVGPSHAASSDDGTSPGLAATAVGVGLAGLIVGVALGLAVQRRVGAGANHPEPGFAEVADEPVQRVRSPRGARCGQPSRTPPPVRVHRAAASR